MMWGKQGELSVMRLVDKLEMDGEWGRSSFVCME